MFCLNHCDRDDHASVNDWLQPFRNGHTDSSELSMAVNFVIGIREGLEEQTTSLFRRFLELSDGKMDCGQHEIKMDYTTSQNAALCTRLLGVFSSHQFRLFDSEDIQNALFKSKLFARLSKSDVADILEWSLRMMALVPVGFSGNYLIQCYQSWGWRTLTMAQNLPSQLLCGFGAGQIDQIRFHLWIIIAHNEETVLTEGSEHTYHRLPSLRREENNILLLLTWSFTYHDQTLKVLRDWIKSEESLNLYQLLIETLWLEPTPETFALILAALLCRERLLPHTVNDIVQLIGGSYLTDFDATLNSQDISNRRAIFEQMTLSLLRVLCTLNISEETVRLLAVILDKEASLLEPLDGIADQYCTKKVHRQNHNKAFEEARESLLKCVETMLKRDRNADAKWTVIPRLSLQLVSAV